MLGIFNKKKEKSFTPTLTSRLFSGVIDCTVILFFLFPIQGIYSDEFMSRDKGATIFQNFDQLRELVTKNNQLTVRHENTQSEFAITDKQTLVIIALQILQLAALSIYVLFFWFKYQATPGKFLISAKIVSASTNQIPSRKQLIIRYLSYALSALPFFVGFFIIPFNKEHRALHDFISNTKVVYYKK